MAGSLIKIDEEIVTSAVASVTLTGIDSTYDVYMVKLNNVQCDTDNQSIRIRVTESGTANSTANYDGADKRLYSDIAFQNGSYTNSTNIFFSESLGTGTGEAFNSILYCFNANNSSEYTFLTYENSNFYQGATLRGRQGGGVFTSASTVDGLQFYMGSGNIDGGTFTLYGLKK